jgi:hypothetical protein
MSIPIQTNQTLLSLQGFPGTPSAQNGSGSRSSAFNQLLAALDQSGSPSASAPSNASGSTAPIPGTSASSGLQKVMQSLSRGLGAAPAGSSDKGTGVSSAQDATAQASGHHHGHHHGGGSSWLTDLLDDNGSATGTAGSASGTVAAGAPAAGSAAYAWQQLAQTDRAHAAAPARSLLAVG